MNDNLLGDLMRARRALRSALSAADAGRSTRTVRAVLDDLGGLVDAIDEAVTADDGAAPTRTVSRCFREPNASR